jgi:hypothetical protein
MSEQNNNSQSQSTDLQPSAQEAARNRDSQAEHSGVGMSGTSDNRTGDPGESPVNTEADTQAQTDMPTADVSQSHAHATGDHPHDTDDSTMQATAQHAAVEETAAQDPVDTLATDTDQQYDATVQMPAQRAAVEETAAQDPVDTPAVDTDQQYDQVMGDNLSAPDESAMQATEQRATAEETVAQDPADTPAADTGHHATHEEVAQPAHDSEIHNPVAPQEVDLTGADDTDTPAAHNQEDGGEPAGTPASVSDSMESEIHKDTEVELHQIANDAIETIQKLQEELKQTQLAYDEIKGQLDEQEKSYKTLLEKLRQQRDAVASDHDRIYAEKEELQKQHTLLQDEVQRLCQALDARERQSGAFKAAFLELDAAIKELDKSWYESVYHKHPLHAPYQHLVAIWNKTVDVYNQGNEAAIAGEMYLLGEAFNDVLKVWRGLWSLDKPSAVVRPFNAAHDAWRKAYANLPHNRTMGTVTEADRGKLANEIGRLHASNEQLANDLATVRSYNTQLEQQIQELRNQARQPGRWQPANRRNLEQLDRLEQQAQRAAALEAELNATREQLAKAETDRRQLLGELGQRDTDFDNTSVSGSRPQHEELVRRFRQLRDDGIEPAVRAIFNYMSRQDPSLKSPGQRREKLAFIKASISTRILVEVEVGESSDVQTSSDRVVVEQILHRLELPAQAQELDEIRGLLVPLVAEGLQLAQQVEAAHPRGILWIEKVGEPFDSQRHETVAGSSESGPVSFTIFPGYDVGNRILVPAVVWTSKIRN